MRSRIAGSVLFILIAAGVTTRHSSGLLKEFRLLHASCATKSSEVRVLMNLNCASGRPGLTHVAKSVSIETQIVPLQRSAGRQFFCSRVRSLRELVLNLIDVTY